MEDKTSMKGESDFVDLERLSKLVEGMSHARIAFDDCEVLLKECRETLRIYEEEKIPEAMIALGVSEITLTNGRKLSIQKQYFAKIPQNKKEEAHQWLIDNNLGSLIKKEVITREGVHHLTLKALVKERFEQGADIPEDLFGIYVKNTTKITNK